MVDCGVARHDPKVGITQFDTDAFPYIAFALQVVGHTFAQRGKDVAQLGLVAHGVQVALESGFPADADRLAVRDHEAVVTPMGGIKQPGAVAAAKVLHQPKALASRQFAQGVNAQCREFGICLGANAVELAARQGPDQARDIIRLHDADAIGLVELAGKFRQQFVGRNANGAGELRGIKNALLNQSRQRITALSLAARYVGQVDIYLVNAPVFHHGGNFGDDSLEALRIFAVAIKMGGQQNGLRAQARGFHQPHGRAHAKLPGRVGGGGDDAAPGVAAQPRKGVYGDVGIGFAVLRQQCFIVCAARTANNDR